jgi:ribosomal protein RSM22 (predicted rRNA methylase)
VSARLPPALQDAIARFAEEIAPKELAARAAALSERYRSGGASHVAIADERDVAAYLTTRLPATYAAMAAALDAVKQRALRFAPMHLLDVGAGPGTASWAATEIWPELPYVVMLDRNPHLLAAARTLTHSSPHPSLTTAQFISADLAKDFPPPERVEGPLATAELSRARASPSEADGAKEGGWGSLGGTYDLVLAGYTFAELPAHTRDRALSNLWAACCGVLVIVEPGTPAGFATILACRTALLALGARVVAPCPAGYPCPIVAPDWCHFAERLPRSRAHMRAKGAIVPFEDEKFSYVAVAREAIELAALEARIVAPPQASKPGIRLRLCADAKLADRVVLKRDKPAFKAVTRKKWGDAL